MSINSDVLENRCIICRKSSSESLKCFQSSCWINIRNAASLRSEFTRDSFREATSRISCSDAPSSVDCYHSSCLRRFTAVKRPKILSDTPQRKSTSDRPTRSQNTIPVTTNRGVLEKCCLICNKSRKYYNGCFENLSACSTFDACARIESAARMQDTEASRRVLGILNSGGDLLAQEAHYHPSCRRKFVKITENSAPDSSMPSTRKFHEIAFEKLKDFITDEILRNDNVLSCSSIYSNYTSEFISLGGNSDDIELYRKSALLEKIKKKFRDEITISFLSKRDGMLIHNANVSLEDAKMMFFGDKSYQFKVELRSVALKLRALILQLPSTKIPTPTTVDSLKRAAADIPPELVYFFKHLIDGVRSTSGDIDCKVSSLASDVVFCTSHGSVKPWKNINFGLGISSLTGSKTVVQLLNRAGHSINYSEVKQIESEFAYAIAKNDKQTPDGLQTLPNLATGLTLTLRLRLLTEEEHFMLHSVFVIRTKIREIIHMRMSP